MTQYLDILLGKAFQIVPGEAYNRYRAQAERRSEPRGVFYEVSLMEERPWTYLRDRIYPSFARYLKYTKRDPQGGEGVVVAIFHGDQCYLLQGPDFLRAFQEVEGVEPAVFALRIRQWLSH